MTMPTRDEVQALTRVEILAGAAIICACIVSALALTEPLWRPYI